MREKSAFCLLVLALQVIFAGSAGSALGAFLGAGSLDEELTLQQAIDAYRGGNLFGAQQLLQRFVREDGASPLLPQAYLYLARIALDQNQPSRSLEMLGKIPPGQRDQREAVVRGAALIALGESGAGMDLLHFLDASRLGGNEEMLRLTALARGARAEGDLLRSLLFAHEGAQRFSAEASALSSLAHQVLNEISDAGLREAVFMFEGSSVGSDARLQLARRTYVAGDRSVALQQMENLLRGAESFAYRSEALAFYDQLKVSDQARRSVGVILPLTGRYAGFGDLIRRGMDLALEIHNRKYPPVEFIYRDGAGDPEKSAAYVQSLAREDGVMAIAGPLSGPASQAAAERAQQEQVPLLSLSQKNGLPEIGPFVFRNSLTSALQARAIARYAVEELGLKSFGILSPENKLGQELSGFFAQEVRRLGGEVRAQQSYGTEATDFGRQIRVLQGLRPESSKRDHKSKELVSEQEQVHLNFQALFIPDYADNIAMIAPQLPYYGIKDIQLLGINGWNSPDLVRQAGNALEGAVFVDGFFSNSSFPFVKDFVDLYLEKFGKNPSILEAQGFDVAGILLSALDRPAVRSREDLRRELSQLRNYPGVTGATGFSPQGEAEKVLFLLQVKNGNIIQIN